MPEPIKLRFLSLALVALAPLLLHAGDEGTASATLLWTKGQEKQKLLLSWNGETLRIDQPEKRFILFYREKDGLVIGLEGRDGLYWKFEWPKLAILLQERKAAAARYNASGSNFGLLGESGTNNNAAPPPKAAPLWHYRADVQNPAGANQRTDLPFLLETPILNADGDRTELTLVARCAPKEIGAQSALWLRYTQAAEIVRTVAVRELGPTGLHEAVASLVARQTTPLEFRTEFHGAVSESIVLLSDSWKTGVAFDAERFLPPKNYRETTLTTLEELMGNVQPDTTPSPPAPTANLDPVQRESGH